MKGGSLALVGLAIGVIGVLVAVLIRARWARPVGAILLAVAVLAEVAAVQAGPSHSANGGDGGGQRATLPPTFLSGSTNPPVSPSSGRPPTLPPSTPHLISSIHPGQAPITKTNVVNKEFVRLTNNGTAPVHIGGWVLTNGSFIYTFPVGLTIAPHDSLVVRSGPGTNVAGTVHLNQSHYVWPHTGGHVILKNGAGALQQMCTYPAVSQSNPSASC
jgi:hypothetical protein